MNTHDPLLEPPAPGAKFEKRRFIAGAVCPQCRAEDRLQVEYWSTDDQELEVRNCVACGFRDSAQPPAADKPLAALPRIRRGQQSPVVVAEPLRLLDPAAKPPSEKHD